MSQQMHPQPPVWNWGTLGDASEGCPSWQEGKRRQDPMESNPGWALGAKPNSERRRWRSWPDEGFATFFMYVRTWEKTARDLSETAWRAPS